ncbi:helix-turn-helix domain-containing protein [Magnetovibrio blakemorei]|uniref:HTH cro/C1-type domain-containing protein n=1 Tax=Magnetovibrio blakemorei TaxID=28181 RepID=A0A1E5QB32_9PROT|nr:helix-turn-helix transcriptional regulator [Magnetovibrio blakemorei]OEJ69177.1 hypothetical protein BEN30_03530 [Magnetovibrio blakemorei]
MTVRSTPPIKPKLIPSNDHVPMQRTKPPLTNDFDRFFPIRIKAMRLSLNLSAAMMDRHAGFSPGTTGRLERGELRVYANHLYALCAATGVPIGFFYDTLDDAQSPEASPGGSYDQELEKQRLLLAFMSIKDPTIKRDVFELIETLANEYPTKAP